MTPNELKAYMDRKGLKVSDLAGALGVSTHAIVRWLRGERKVHKTAVKILHYFEKHGLDLRNLE